MGAIVHSGALAAAWTDIDLTRDTAGAGTGVPPTRCLVRLRIKPTSGFSWYAVRPSDDTGNWCPTSVDGHGTSDAAISFVAGRGGEVWAATGPDGHVDIYCAPAAAAVVTVVGWLGTATYSGATIHAGGVPLAWTDLDTTIGARGFVFLRDLHTAGWAQDHALRPDGDAGDYLVAGQVGGCSHGKIQAAADVHGFSLETDALGILEHISNVGGAGALSTQIDLLYAVLEGAGWASVGSTVFAAAAPPVAWTALDLTSEIGTYSGPVKLRVHLAAGAPQRQISFRPAGSPLDMRGSAGYAGGTQFVDLGADEVGTVDIEAESGVVEWIASSAANNVDLVLVGYFAAAPTVTGTAPVGTVGTLATVSFTSADDVAVDPLTIQLDIIDPTLAVHSVIFNGAWVAPYTGTITPNGSNGYDVDVLTHPDFMAGAWSAAAQVTDGAGLTGTDTWNWTVDPPPTVTGLTPVGTVDRDAPLSFTCSDNTDVIANTITLYLTDPALAVHLVIVAGVWQAGYTGTILANGTHGFDVDLLTHPVWAEGAWTATAVVFDGYGSPGGDVWGWTVEWIPELISARASARRKVTLTFDVTVRLRAVTTLPPLLSDRYTPVDWLAAGGGAADAQNPANYTVTHVPGGNLDGPGEAVDLTVIAVEEPETGVTIDGGYRVCAQIVLVVDFEQTARCDYNVAVANVVHTTGVIDPAHDDQDFDGYIVSWVPRQSLHLYDILPPLSRRLDDTGELELFCTVIQEVFDRFTEDIDAFFNELCTLDYMRPEWLDGLLYDLGDQYSEIFNLTTNEKRRLAGALVSMYRRKGTCIGMVEAIDFFMGITILGCRGGWDDCWTLAGGAYPAPYDGSYLSEGVYPAASGGDAYLGPVGYEVYSFWLLHAAPGTLTADQLTKIAAIVDLIKPAYTHYMGVTAP